MISERVKSKLKLSQKQHLAVHFTLLDLRNIVNVSIKHSMAI